MSSSDEIEWSNENNENSGWQIIELDDIQNFINQINYYDLTNQNSQSDSIFNSGDSSSDIFDIDSNNYYVLKKYYETKITKS